MRRRLNTRPGDSLPQSVAGLRLTVSEIDDEAVLLAAVEVGHEDADFVICIDRRRVELGVAYGCSLKAAGLQDVAVRSAEAFGISEIAMLFGFDHFRLLAV